MLNMGQHIPIIEDYNGRTPLDISLAIEEKYKLSTIFTPDEVTDDTKKTNISISMAGILFACTKDYTFLHSAHSLTDAIIKAI